MEKLDVSEIHPSRINAREVLITQKEDEFIFPVADGTAKLSGRDYEFRKSTLSRKPTVKTQISAENFKVNQESLNRQNQQMMLKASADVRSIQGDFIHRHHNESRVQLHVLKEETFPFPLKYIDVTRSTHTDQDVMQEKQVDDYWNVD